MERIWINRPKRAAKYNRQGRGTEGESSDGWIDESWTGDRGKCDRHYDEGDDNGSAADEDTLRAREGG